MSLVTRVLPCEEWTRLAETDLRDVWQLLSPESARVLVVEDEGRIVGHCVVLTWVHAEGFGVHPDYRRKGDVWRRLLRAIGETSREASVTAVIAGSANEEMSGYLTRLGGTLLPASFYVVPMNGFFVRKEKGSCLQ